MISGGVDEGSSVTILYFRGFGILLTVEEGRESYEGEVNTHC